MTIEIIYTGELPNDGRGDPLRTAFTRINNNFAQLFTAINSGGPDGAIQFNYIDSSGDEVTKGLRGTGSLVFNINTNTLNIDANIVPLTSNVFTVGNITNRFKDVYVSGNGFHLGNAIVTESGNLITFSVEANSAIKTDIIAGNATFSSVSASNLISLGSIQYGNINTVDTAYAETTGTLQGQVIFETPANSFSSGEFIIKSVDTVSLIGQHINISVSRHASGNSVKNVQYGTLFDGTAITRYDVDLVNNNVRLLIDPITPNMMTHTINYRIAR